MVRLFQVFVPATVVGLIVSEILLTFGCYVAAFFLTSEEVFEIYYPYEGGFERTAIVVLGVILGLYFNDLYSDLRVRSRLYLGQQYCLVLGIAFLTQALLSYVSRDLTMDRWQMIAGSALALVVLPTWRIAYDRFVLRLMGTQRILFVGESDALKVVAGRILHYPEYGYSAGGYLSNSGSWGEGFEAIPYLGDIAQLRRQAEETRPDLIVVGLRERRGQLPVTELLRLRLQGALVEEAGKLYESVTSRVAIESLRPSDLVFSSQLGPKRGNVILQRTYSFLFALIGLLVTSPLLAFVAIAIKLSGPGPIVFKQKRVGLNGKIFNLYKFRSMREDAEVGTGAVWAQKDDPRITGVGKLLRKLRIDEIPQFWNVLKGEMAIVGPRPERPEFVEVLSREIPFYGYRHAILPGITGWAQINHKYGDTMEDTASKLEYDLYYLKNLGPSLDLYIIFHTIKVMLLRRGAQ